MIGKHKKWWEMVPIAYYNDAESMLPTGFFFIFLKLAGEIPMTKWYKISTNGKKPAEII